MGRSLFSSTYHSEPEIRTEPEPTVDGCERWNSVNPFDPDSDEFFKNAEYEAFIDPARYQRELAPLPATAISDSEGSEPSERSGSDRGSPMAVGSDDPAILISDVVASRLWAERGATEPEWQAGMVSHSTAAINYATGPSPGPSSATFPFGNDPDTPAFIPPSIFREPTPGIEDRDVVIPAPRSPTLRRNVNITPIRVTTVNAAFDSRSSSPDSSDTPSTPPMQSMPLRRQPRSAATMLSPSPPPTVTPRFYSWQHHPIPAIPSSPTVIRANRNGPLTNARARISFARIDSSPLPLAS